MPGNKTNKTDLNKSLKHLEKIGQWFEEQDEVDVEMGLKKIKEAVALLKLSKERLKSIENEFEEIKKEVSQEDENES